MRLQTSDLLHDARNVELLRLLYADPRKLAELARRLQQVVECHRVTGEDCLVMKVHLPGLDQLDEVLGQFLAFGQTTTSIVQSTPVPPWGLPLPGNGATGQGV